MKVFSSSVSSLQGKLDQKIFSEESSDALSGLYGQISTLSTLAGKLTTTDTDSVFNDRTAQSSDSSVLTATAWDAYTQETGATSATYDISVSQLAQSQVNSSTDLNGMDESIVDTGVNTFNINISDQNYELNIEVAEGDTNEDVLNEIASVINSANSGVTAEIIDDEGTLNLLLTSDNTGEAASFTISDVSGNAISATNLDTVTTTAQNALYSVDGEEMTSETNTVYLDNGAVEVSLQGTGDTILEVGTDDFDFYNAIASLASGINSFIDFFNENSDYLKEDIISKLNSILDDHEVDLEYIGITIDDEEKLQVDEDVLSSVISSNPSAVEDIFASFDGLAEDISSFTSKVASDSPLNYAKEADSLSTEFSDFIYDSSAMQLKQLLAGSMLDMYV
jgi:flagellar hook-associated protein 2